MNDSQKATALEIMRRLDIYKPYINGFKNSGRVCFFENYGGEDFVKLSFAENIAYQNVMDAAKTTVAGQDAE